MTPADRGVFSREQAAELLAALDEGEVWGRFDDGTVFRLPAGPVVAYQEEGRLPDRVVTVLQVHNDKRRAVLVGAAPELARSVVQLWDRLAVREAELERVRTKLAEVEDALLWRIASEAQRQRAHVEDIREEVREDADRWAAGEQALRKVNEAECNANVGKADT